MPDYLVLALVLIAFAIGIMLGHAAGYARRGDVERRRQEAARTGGPKYRRGGFRVDAPSGLYIETPSRESAEAFASRFGGDVRPSE